MSVVKRERIKEKREGLGGREGEQTDREAEGGEGGREKGKDKKDREIMTERERDGEGKWDGERERGGS